MVQIWESAIDGHVRCDSQDYSFIFSESPVAIVLAGLVHTCWEMRKRFSDELDVDI